jgi:hypothetical protein
MRQISLIALIVIGIMTITACGSGSSPISPEREAETVFGNQYVVLGYNDLGMHCINQDFSELAVLPPFNNLYAQVIRRGDDPQIVTSGVTINYSILGNTHSADKSNFWTYLHNLGIPIPNNIGLTGHGMSGSMVLAAGRSDWVVDGIPIIPVMDNGALNPYPLSSIKVYQGGALKATTEAVVPVSWEMSCNLCHKTAGYTTARDILHKHDLLHGTHLEAKQPKPVLCGSCHRQPPLEPLGLHGNPNLPTLSRAMHHSHSTRMAPVMGATGGIECYACHPGLQTKCYRDVHFAKGFKCSYCHGNMATVADPAREPWAQEPRCGSCHNRLGWEYEQPNTLFRNSLGHMGIHCEACHGSPHAIVPTNQANDNWQSINAQGHAGTIDNCLVCHTQLPDDQFPHRYSGGD